MTTPALTPRKIDTRDHILQVAMKLYGQSGYRGVTARQIASVAGVPAASVIYHFQSMDQLYESVILEVIQRIGEQIHEPVVRITAALQNETGDWQAILVEFKRHVLHAIALAPESQDWARVFLREHLDPTQYFSHVYQDAMKNVIELIAHLIARRDGLQSDDESVKLQAFAQLGEILIFRIAQHALLKSMKWNRMTTKNADKIFAALNMDA